MCFIDNPLDSYEEETIDAEELFAMLPRCSECEKPIQDEFCFVINGEAVCEPCMDQYRQPTAYLMG